MSTETIHDWPALLRGAALQFDPRGMSVAGPRTVTGRTFTLGLDAGYWVATLALARLDKGDGINAFRALRARLQGASHAIRVPAHDQGQAPWVNAGGQAANELAASDYTDATDFTDGTGFYEPAIVVTLKTVAELRETEIEATVTTAGTISAGMLFSIRDRLYVVRDVIEVSGADQTWRIWPPLREDVFPAGLRLDFERPVCRMKLTGDDAMDLPLQRLWQAQPTITFEEAN